MVPSIKVFGEDLDVLFKKASEIEKAIQNVEGAADITVEKITGLPQMSVQFDRQRIAKYGLNIEELNKIFRSTTKMAADIEQKADQKSKEHLIRYDMI